MSPPAEGARFAWQGFELQLSEKWRPTILSGSYKEGYVCLEGERGGLVQARWKASRRGVDLRRRVLAYFGKLERAARKRKTGFKGMVGEEADAKVDFEWHAGLKGYGIIFFDSATSRVILLERSGRAEDSFKREAREMCASVRTFGSGKQPWIVLGLSVRLPLEYHLESCKFLAGRTTLNFKARGARLSAERWAFAEQLLAKRSLVDWAKAVSGLEEVVQAEPERVLLRGTPGWVGRLARWSICALVVYQPWANQLSFIKSTHRPGKEPDWCFLE